MTVTGQWVNSYGSLMDITQDVDGLVTGTYSSTTGSTGNFNVLGYANPTDAVVGSGQSVALTVYWRSFSGGTPDATWNWTPGLSGQLSLDADSDRIYTMHTMDATSEFVGLSPIGTFNDKLI
ncbi:MAG: hypothetical protein HRU28_03245 [Rhizobiales bacterium]|nr:hypothetical protein [Hyphomicrobiales bacterium]